MTSGCEPAFEEHLSLVERPRLLAIQTEPAEASPGDFITLRALVASPDPSAVTSLDWAFCAERKPLTELGPINERCLQPSGPSLLPLGSGDTIEAKLPSDVCRVFGPDRPAPKPGEPAGRPVDPDPSGGYFQPFRLRLPLSSGDEYSSASVRTFCGLASATQEQTQSFAQAYRNNENPRVESLFIGETELSAASTGRPHSIPRGNTTPLRVQWPLCPRSSACGDGVCFPGEDATHCASDCAKPQGCGGAESYIWFDPQDPRLALRREGLRVSWFATAGQFDQEHTGQGEYDDDTTSSTNRWTAPNFAAEVTLWVVIRDDRGGSGWEQYRLRIE